MNNTVDSILEALSKMSESKNPIDVFTYLNGAEKLNALVQDEESELYLLEQIVAKMRVELLNNGKNATEAKMIIEASDEYLKARKQKSKINRVLETIRLSKIHARMSQDIYKSQ